MRLVITHHPVSGRDIQSGTLPAHPWPKLRNPTERQLARRVGLISPLDPAHPAYEQLRGAISAAGWTE